MSESLRHWITQRYLPQNLDVRDEKTRKHYQRAINDLGELLGREPSLTDLTDENLTALIVYLLGPPRSLAEVTANGIAGRLRAFWTWAAKKRLVDQWPTFSLAPEPEKIPLAWREDELVKLFNACRMLRGDLCGIPAWRWWMTLHGFLWCSGERIGATLAMRLDHLRLDDRVAVLPASIRKGKRKPAVHHLWIDLVEMFRMILPPHAPHRELVFPWPKHHTTMYYYYGRILDSAGLPNDRYCKPHKMRVSHATWAYLAGDDPTRRLGHSDPATTRKSYIDPTLAKQDESKLFRPW
jgi:integrase